MLDGRHAVTRRDAGRDRFPQENTNETDDDEIECLVRHHYPKCTLTHPADIAVISITQFASQSAGEQVGDKSVANYPAPCRNALTPFFATLRRVEQATDAYRGFRSSQHLAKTIRGSQGRA